MKIKLKLALCASFFLLACSAITTDQGPGMITNFGSMMEGRSARLQAITLPNGTPAMSGFTVRGGRVPGWRQAVGRTTGMSGDTRALPEWLDFAWQEPSYPGPQPSDFATREGYSKFVFDEKATLPVKTQRVFISSRIPPEVVQEVTYSRSHIPKGQHLPEKMLWIYFIWTDDGIKFRWEMSCDKPCVEKGGGDEIN
ncbi:hypothetical protein ABC383_12195 [Noviherbaspirillum sp. 1P10PC]|uniref:hypothetical protein n=1 Tax=Noviherbaspirillum sp. 1P10PC TaxID=3132292 RepID=UPI0039A14EDD